MADLTIQGRWPSLYSAEELRTAIDDILDRKGSPLASRFYVNPGPTSFAGGDLCQGDVLRLTAPVPSLADDGVAYAGDEAYDFWLTLGNTCDFERVDVPATVIVPMAKLSQATEKELEQMRRYAYARKFYIPDWPQERASGEPAAHYMADFTQMVTLSKGAIGSKAVVVARMQFSAWALLHLALVRFLARSDGRFD